MLVKLTYLRCNALFNKKGREVVVMLASGQVYAQVLIKVKKMHRERQMLTLFFSLINVTHYS